MRFTCSRILTCAIFQRSATEKACDLFWHFACRTASFKIEPPLTTLACDVLRNDFQLSDFRPGQLDAILSIARGEDVVVRFGTNGGKSLCYQLPRLLGKSSCAVIVSPLSALMREQVQTPSDDQRQIQLCRAGFQAEKPSDVSRSLRYRCTSQALNR